MKRKHDGFTIVELLIVIVVIAILAAISIVSYNGIQTRAKNTSIEQAILTYKKALTSYMIEYGFYPTTTSACMGEAVSFPGGCYGAGPSSTFASELKKVIATLPNVNTDCYEAWGGCRKNFAFYVNGTWTIDGQPHRNYIIYYIGGSANCGIPNTLEGGYGNFATTTSRGYMERRGSESMCVLALPNSV